MEFFINSEKHLSNVGELSFDEIMNLSGYPPLRNYKIIDEFTHKEYFSGDMIRIENNVSFMIQEIN